MAKIRRLSYADWVEAVAAGFEPKVGRPCTRLFTQLNFIERDRPFQAALAARVAIRWYLRHCRRDFRKMVHDLFETVPLEQAVLPDDPDRALMIANLTAAADAPNDQELLEALFAHVGLVGGQAVPALELVLLDVRNMLPCTPPGQVALYRAMARALYARDREAAYFPRRHEVFREPAVWAQKLTGDAAGLLRGMFASGDWGAAPVLADALEEAEAAHPDVLLHLRSGWAAKPLDALDWAQGELQAALYLYERGEEWSPRGTSSGETGSPPPGVT